MKNVWLVSIFFAGHVAGINLSLIYPNDNYDGEMWRVLLSVVLAVFFAFLVLFEDKR